MLDERLARHLHVESLRGRELHPEHQPHVLFQTSTIGALLDGAYDGDVTFAQLAEHGDLGIGTLDALDGEMIALDGRFYRADVDGRVSEVDPDRRTPFAVVTWFEAEAETALGVAHDHGELLARLDRLATDADGMCAVRIAGDWDFVRARSVPAQRRPYRPLAEVVADQHVFELHDVSGTMVGFRFPGYAEGLEVAGYHLHFIDSERRRGGHVLDSRLRTGHASVDRGEGLHVELPPGVQLESPDLDEAMREAVARVERGGR
jgi:acetolactate decarboxylase